LIYFQRNRTQVEELVNPDNNILLYPDVEDVRNYAFFILYENDKELFLRTSDLKYHFIGLKLLYKSSKYLKKIVTYKDVCQIDHVWCDYKLAKSGNILMYQEDPSLVKKKDLGGFLYLPHSFTPYQKSWLLEHEKYLHSYRDIGIYQFNMENQAFQELTLYGEENYLPVLKKLTQ